MLLRIAAAGASYPIRVDPLVQQARLTASDGAEFDQLGGSAAISGRTIVVGVPSATLGSNVDQGAAYVFVRTGPAWADATQTAKLTSSNGASFDILGTSVAISGDTIVAGTPGAAVDGGDQGHGEADVFVKPASGWADGTQTAQLSASDGVPEDSLGQSVAIDGNTIVAGAPAPPVTFTPHHGGAYVFVEPRSGWANGTQTAKLTASDGAEGDNFGFAISGGTIVVGAPFASVSGNLFQGAAYVF